MLNLTLRDEFRDKRLKGTAIELSNESRTGATQIAARDFLEITYPTHDLLRAIDAVGPNQGRPVVVIGERGLGKSHLLAALYHAVHDADSTGAWLQSWAQTLKDPAIGRIALRRDMLVIGESLHRQRYKFLWDLLFDRHPHGTYIRGKWEGRGEARPDVPSDALIVELLERQPTMLLLDEFQTWFDGLTNTKQYPWKSWAFNFIQILSEVARERPDLLVLVISVRNGGSDAYQQMHRVNPFAVDFMAGGNPERVQQDRRRMLLHRLFTNRLNIHKADIEALIAPHVDEHLRLTGVPAADHDKRRREFLVSWPFAPHLLRLLEEQVLVATNAQETRDLIRILASLYKSRGEAVPVLTAADFRLDDDTAGIGALLDSVANEQHRTLRAKAQQNVLSVIQTVADSPRVVPHLQDVLAALWLRSIAVGNLAGADLATLQVDVTRTRAIDDNAFQVELAAIVENSFNIHRIGARLVFREEENPRARLMAHARNDRLFADGSDQAQLARQIRYVIGGGDEVARRFRVLALPRSWQTDPWSALEEAERPERWDDRLPMLVLPEEPEALDAQLGRWVKDQLPRRRNTVRFVLPRAGSGNAYLDRELLILARAELKAQEWGAQDPEYRKLHKEFETALRDALKKRFDRFAVLARYDHQNPQLSRFSVELLRQQGAQIPEAVEESLAEDLFVPEDFEAFVVEAAASNASVGKVLRELQEPRPAGHDCIVWLGETAMKERIVRLCARGRIAINLRNMEYLQAQAGEDEEASWRRLRPKLSYTGRQLDEVQLLLPSAVPATGGAAPLASMPAAGGAPERAAGLFSALSTPSGPGAAPVPAPGPVSAEGSAAPPSASLPTPTQSIFGPAVSAGLHKASYSHPPTSPLNLIGRLEAWGIGPATPLSGVSIKLDAASGAQLRELLRKLPDGLTFGLSLDKDGS